jgi:hypothetical protein
VEQDGEDCGEVVINPQKTDRTLVEENLKNLLHYDNFSGTECMDFTVPVYKNHEIHALRA